jgi:hypothetical protein
MTLFDFLKTEIHISKRNFLLVTIFFFVFYESYYFLFSNLLIEAIPFGFNRDVIQGTLHFFTAIFLLFGGFFLKKFNKLRIIYGSSFSACLLTLLLLVNLFEGFRLIVIFGLVFQYSLGLIATLSFFGGLTLPVERGRLSGFIGFIVFFLFFVINFSLVLNLNFFVSILFASILNVLPLLGLLIKSFKGKVESLKQQADNYYERRVFVLYFIPWAIFSLINVTLSANTTIKIQQLITSNLHFSLLSMQLVGVIIGVLIGGIISDLLGRRFSLVFSLTFFGFCTALVGIVPFDLVYFIVYFANGLSWGILFVLYFFVVWGDLSNQENRIKIYSIGLAIYFFSLGVGFFVNTNMEIIQSALLSVLIIFLLNLPIIFAPELLPSYIRDRIRMKRHIGIVKKIQKMNQG